MLKTVIKGLTWGQPLIYTPPPAIVYVKTVFDEFTDHPVTGTTPATAPAGATWVDVTGTTPNSDWYYNDAGLNQAFTTSASFLYIDSGVADATLRATIFSVVNPSGGQLLFRLIDSSNYAVVNFAETGFEIYNVIAGAATEIASSSTSLGVGPFSIEVAMAGASITVSSGSQTVSGTIPASSPTMTATKVGFCNFGSRMAVNALSVLSY